MDYELAKQLKDAGFPQTPNNIENMDSFVYMGQITKSEFEKAGRGEITQFANVRIPTLSELIAACGEGFNDLTRDDWYETKGNFFCGRNYMDNEMHELTRSKTPEEAVAKLYIELNKK